MQRREWLIFIPREDQCGYFPGKKKTDIFHALFSRALSAVFFMNKMLQIFTAKFSWFWISLFSPMISVQYPRDFFKTSFFDFNTLSSRFLKYFIKCINTFICTI